MDLCPLWLNGLTPEMAKIAFDELGESIEVKENALNKLKQQLKGEQGLEVIDDDFFLLRYLRLKKFDVQLAFKTLMNYYSFKAKNTGILTDLRPIDLEQVLLLNKIIVSPHRHRSGSGVIYMALGSINLDTISLERLTAAILTILDVVLCNEATQVCGMYFIADLSGMGWRLLGQIFKPSYIVAAIQAITDTWPCRIKSFEVVNEFPFYKTMHNTIAKPLMPNKLKDKLKFHGNNYDDLHRSFPLECLPESIGGKLNYEDYDKFRNAMMNKQDLIIRLNQYVLKGKSYS